MEELVAPERLRPLRRLEYERMAAEGFFEDERIELLEGVIVEMTPQGTRHAVTIERLSHLLFATVGDRARVRVQLPFAASDVSLPEPDVAVVPRGDYELAHPSQGQLIVEVAGSSLNKDRLVKARLYATAGVTEYWVIDIAAKTIEVCCEPVDGQYTRLHAAGPGGSIRLQAFPDVEIAVADVVR
ncbi:MAG TPA: Uma2 family endonuclease [Polyangia bacterium]|nr:Uma2 family endonuclease [Polyangia bacterium]